MERRDWGSVGPVGGSVVAGRIAGGACSAALRRRREWSSWGGCSFAAMEHIAEEKLERERERGNEDEECLWRERKDA